MNILEKIVKQKNKEIKWKKMILPISSFNKVKHWQSISFKKALQKDSRISIIAEIKKKSPSAGIIMHNISLLSLAKIYKRNGASAISVLTDSKFFGGNDEMLGKIKSMIDLPLLRKEFIIDKYQIYESKYLGADAILLIAKILTPIKLKEFVKIASDIGLDTLVEITNIKELENAFASNTKIIGINNRNLNDFKINTGNSIELIEHVPDVYITVSESGVKNREDILTLEKNGFNAALIGTSLLKAKDAGNKLKELLED